MAATDTGDPPVHASRHRTRMQRAIIGVWIGVPLLLFGLLAAGVYLYARGGGDLPPGLSFLRPADSSPLDASSPAEVVLRTLRLAGYQRAVVGEQYGKVVVRVEAPSVQSPADLGLTWQTCMAAAAVAYPKADDIVVQVFSPNQPLAEISAHAEAVRRAVRDDDMHALDGQAAVRYLPETAGD